MVLRPMLRGEWRQCQLEYPEWFKRQETSEPPQVLTKAMVAKAAKRLSEMAHEPPELIELQPTEELRALVRDIG